MAPLSGRNLSNTSQGPAGIPTDDQEPPFQCSTSIEPSSRPTAHTLVVDVAATPASGAYGTLLSIVNGGWPTVHVAACAVALTQTSASADEAAAVRRAIRACFMVPPELDGPWGSELVLKRIRNTKGFSGGVEASGRGAGG